MGSAECGVGTARLPPSRGRLRRAGGSRGGVERTEGSRGKQMVMDTDLLQPTPEERELARQLDELAGLEEALGEKERALARLERELRVFEVQYLAVVGKGYA